jgi:hypothetical protein
VFVHATTDPATRSEARTGTRAKEKEKRGAMVLPA